MLPSPQLTSSGGISALSRPPSPPEQHLLQQPPTPVTPTPAPSTHQPRSPVCFEKGDCGGTLSPSARPSPTMRPPGEPRNVSIQPIWSLDSLFSFGNSKGGSFPSEASWPCGAAQSPVQPGEGTVPSGCLDSVVGAEPRL